MCMNQDEFVQYGLQSVDFVLFGVESASSVPVEAFPNGRHRTSELENGKIPNNKQTEQGST